MGFVSHAIIVQKDFIITLESVPISSGIYLPQYSAHHCPKRMDRKPFVIVDLTTDIMRRQARSGSIPYAAQRYIEGSFGGLRIYGCVVVYQISCIVATQTVQCLVVGLL